MFTLIPRKQSPLRKIRRGANECVAVACSIHSPSLQLRAQASPNLHALQPSCPTKPHKQMRPGGVLIQGNDLVAQHCDPPYCAIGYSYTYRIYVFQGIAGYRAILWGGGEVSHNYADVFESTWGGGVSQVKAALSAIGRFGGVSQLYCRKSRFNGPLRATRGF